MDTHESFSSIVCREIAKLPPAIAATLTYGDGKHSLGRAIINETDGTYCPDDGSILDELETDGAAAKLKRLDTQEVLTLKNCRRCPAGAGHVHFSI